MVDPVEFEFAGVKAQILPLKFKIAQPMIPMVGELLSIAVGDMADLVKSGKIDVKVDILDPKIIFAVLPSLRNVAQFLEGRLERFAPKILSTTRVAVGDEWQELSKEKDYEKVFDEHPEMYLPLLFKAGRVTFGRYFPAGVLRAGATRTPSL